MATFTVTSNSGADVTGSLREAVRLANANPDADTIVFQGVSGTIDLTGQGALVVNQALTITGPGAGDLTILADAGTQILEIATDPPGGAVFETAISGVTLSGVNGGGAAIYAGDTNLALTGVTISGNAADLAGTGGILFGGAGNLTITGSTISGNTGVVGGVVYTGDGTLTVESSTITGNTGGGVGGVYFSGLGNLVIRGSTISGNAGDPSSTGGGSPNAAGGVLFFGAGDFTLESSTVSGNTTGTDGVGGVFFLGSGQLTVSGSTFNGNNGGVGALYTAGGAALLVNATVAGNSGGGGAGGILLDGTDAVLRSSTIVGNSDVTGFAVVDGVGALGAVVLIENSIIYSAGGVEDLASDGSTITANNSLVGTYLSICGCSPVLLGTNLLMGVDPLLAALANNGGAVMTMLPLSGSPAINGGNAALTHPSLDATGRPRFSGGQIDLGAVEIQFAPAAPPQPPPSQAPVVNGQFANLLRFQTYGSNPPLPPTVTTPEGQTVLNPLLVQQAVVKALIAQVDAGRTTLAAATDLLVDMADSTTSVATLSYQFFTGKLPTKAGLDYLVSSPQNPADLNDGYYAGMALENRYINFAVNLGKQGEGRAAFEAGYGGLSLTDAATKAYTEIFGPPAAGKIADILTPDRIAYFNALGGDAPGSQGLGAKAAMVGWLLAESAKSDIGPYAVMNENFLYDMADGQAAFGADAHIYLNAGPRFVGLVGVAGEL